MSNNDMQTINQTVHSILQDATTGDLQNARDWVAHHLALSKRPSAHFAVSYIVRFQGGWEKFLRSQDS